MAFTRRTRRRLRAVVPAVLVLALGVLPAPRIWAQTIEIQVTDGVTNCDPPLGLLNPFNRPALNKLDLVVCFNPATATIQAGDTVTWVNTGEKSHDVTAYDWSWGSPVIEAGSSWSYTFTQPGEIAYVCTAHSSTVPGDTVPTGQAGKLTVEGDPAPDPTPTPTLSPRPTILPTPTPSLSGRARTGGHSGGSQVEGARWQAPAWQSPGAASGPAPQVSSNLTVTPIQETPVPSDAGKELAAAPSAPAAGDQRGIAVGSGAFAVGLLAGLHFFRRRPART